jgi:hypothetical protein
MKSRHEVTCDDCYFRRNGLCALASAPCPTFRAAAGSLEPPRQPRLVPRPAQLAVGHAA